MRPRKLSPTARAALGWLAQGANRTLMESISHTDTGPDYHNVRFVAGYLPDYSYSVPVPVFRVLVREGLVKPAGEAQVSVSHQGEHEIETRRTYYRLSAAGREALLAGEIGSDR